MPEGQEPTQPPVEPTSTTSISPDILSSLGLTPENVQQFDAEEVKKKQEIEGTRQAGANAYRTISERSVHGAFDLFVNLQSFGGLSLRGISLSEYVPDAIIREFERQKAGGSLGVLPKTTELFMSRIKAWLEGFGAVALDANDWRTGVNSFDIVTDGKVIERPDIMGKLRTIATTDKTQGVGIAKAIQGGVDKRVSQTTPASVPQQPTT